MANTQEVNEHDKAYNKVHSMSDARLKGVWDALKDYDPSKEYAPGVSMDDWANMVYMEISRRNIAWK